MPRPEPYEKLMQHLPTLAERVLLVRASFAEDDAVMFFKDGEEIEGKIVSIKQEEVVVKTRFGDFSLERKDLFY